MTEVVHRQTPRVAEVAVLRHEMAKAADELNREIQATEAAFVAMRLNVRASVSLHSSLAGAGEYDALVFDRFQGAWRLLYTTGTFAANDYIACPH